MKQRVRKHRDSFKFAWEGLLWAFRTQHNLQFHIVLAVLVVLLGFVLEIRWLEMAIVLLTICVVIMAEMLNTAIESVVDLVTESWNIHAKIAKDVSAGMVLITAVGAIIVGVCVYMPYLLVLFYPYFVAY